MSSPSTRFILVAQLCHFDLVSRLRRFSRDRRHLVEQRFYLRDQGVAAEWFHEYLIEDGNSASPSAFG